MVEKDKIYRVEITDVNNRGDGVCRIENLAVFVKGGVTGDLLDVKIIKTARDYAVAAVDKIIKPSEDRCENDCPVFRRCGGCVTRHITYDCELKLKSGYVRSALRRAGIDDVLVHETVSAGMTDGYRNKAQYPVGIDKKTGKIKIGFYADHTHDIADAEACNLAPEIFTKIIGDIREFLENEKVSVYDEKSGKGLVRHIYLRMGEKTGEVMLCLVVSSDTFAKEKQLAEFITYRNPEITGVLLNINKRNTNVILSDDYKLICGNDYITDILCGKKFRISKSSFYQVNRKAAELLYQKAAELAKLEDNDVLVDLYCGVGTVGISMAKPTQTLYGIEIVPEAIENAKINAKINGFADTHFVACDAADFKKHIRISADANLVVTVDPPRKGLAPSVIYDIAENSPDKIVYISCNPDTLARDINEFRKYGYTTHEVFPYDLFPRTGHVETCSLLSLKDINNE